MGVSYKEAFKEMNDIPFDVNQIDLTPLVAEIEKLTGLHVEFKASQREQEGKDGWYVQLESQELTDQIGPFATALRHVWITTFNSSVYRPEDWETHRVIEGSSPVWSGNIQFSYEHWGGGSNGAKILSFFYDLETKTWQFLNEKQRRLDYEQRHLDYEQRNPPIDRSKSQASLLKKVSYRELKADIERLAPSHKQLC